MQAVHKSKRRTQKPRAKKPNNEYVWIRGQRSFHQTGTEATENRSVINNTEDVKSQLDKSDVNGNLHAAHTNNCYTDVQAAGEKSSFDSTLNGNLRKGEKYAENKSENSCPQAVQMDCSGMQAGVQDINIVGSVSKSEATSMRISFDSGISSKSPVGPQGDDSSTKLTTAKLSEAKTVTTAGQTHTSVHIINGDRIRSVSQRSKTSDYSSNSNHSGITQNKLSEQNRICNSINSRVQYIRHRNASDMLSGGVPSYPPAPFRFPVHPSFYPVGPHPMRSAIPPWEWNRWSRVRGGANNAQHVQFRERLSAPMAYLSSETKYRTNKNINVDLDRSTRISNPHQTNGIWNQNKIWHNKNTSKCAEVESSTQTQDVRNSQIKIGQTECKVKRNKSKKHKIRNQKYQLIEQVSENEHSRNEDTETSFSDVIGTSSKEQSSRCDRCQREFEPLDKPIHLHSVGQLHPQSIENHYPSDLNCQKDDVHINSHLSVPHSTQKQCPDSPTGDSFIGLSTISTQLNTDQTWNNKLVNSSSNLYTSCKDQLGEYRKENSLNCEVVRNNGQEKASTPTDKPNVNFNIKHFVPSLEGLSKDQESVIKPSTPSAFQSLPELFDPSVHPLQIFPRSDAIHHWLRETSNVTSSLDNSTYQCLTTENPKYSCSEYWNGNNTSFANNSVPLNSLAVISPQKEFLDQCKSYVGSNFNRPDCESNMNQSHTSDFIRTHVEPIATSEKQNPGAAAFSLGIIDEIEEEMALAQSMSIPFITQKKSTQLPALHLNPNAIEFSPKLKDTYGNSYVVTEQKGVCYFLAEDGNLPCNTIIPTESYRPLDGQVADRTIYNPGSVFESYGTLINSANSHIPQIMDSVIKPSLDQQVVTSQFDKYGLSLYTYLNDAQREDSNMDPYAQTIYSTAEYVPSLFASTYIPQFTLGNESNHIQTGTVYSTMRNPDWYVGSPNLHQPDLSHPMHTPDTLPTVSSNESLQSSAHTHYASPGYPLHSYIPMYVTPSPVTTSTITPLSGSVFLQSQGLPGLSHTTSSFTGPVQAHKETTHQVQPRFFPATEPVTPVCSAQTLLSQKPVFNVQTFYTATTGNSINGNGHYDIHALKESHTTAYLRTSRSQGHSDSDKDWDMYNKEIHSQWDRDNLQYLETCGDKLNHSRNSLISTHPVNMVADIGHKLASPAIATQVNGVRESRTAVPELNSFPEYHECKRLVEKLNNRKVSLDQLRRDISSEPENRQITEKWFEMALSVIDRNQSNLSIDEMTTVIVMLARHSH